MFRALGPHGETSNPSPVYQVELYSDGGVAYPITRLYEFGQESSKTTTKTMKNLLRITPRITQALINEQASGLVDENGNVLAPSLNDIVLGLEDEVLFGKKFKIRITSKNTGKKMDLNVTFTTEAVQNNSVSDPTGFVLPHPSGAPGLGADAGNDSSDNSQFYTKTSTSATTAGPAAMGAITPSGGGGGSGY